MSDSMITECFQSQGAGVRSALLHRQSRRRMLTQSMLGAFCGCTGHAAFGGGCELPSRDDVDTASVVPDTPEAVLRYLLEGNIRFAEGKSRAANRDIQRVKEVAREQRPFAAFLGCADSRVPIEIVFDQGFGDLFVTRIAGNVASSENIGSLEFGTEVLGARVLYVLGHTNCGAVSAAMKGDDVPGQISGLFQHIRPAVKSAEGNLQKAIADNVRNQAVLLAEASPVISKLVKRKELIVAGGIYDLATGLVSPVDVDAG